MESLRSNINSQPVGLLSLLGIKSLGQNPWVLSNEVASTVDLLQLYIAERAQIYGGATIAVNAVGPYSAPQLAPDPGKILLLSQIQARRSSAIAAATSYRVRLVVYDTQTGFHAACSPTFASGTAGEAPCLGWAGPIIVRPSQAVGLWCEQVTLGTAQTWDIRATGIQLDI